MFVILSGRVKISRISDDGREVILSILSDGDFFGEMALMHHENRSATIRSVSPCMMYELKAEDFDRFMKQQPEIAEVLRETDTKRREALKAS